MLLEWMGSSAGSQTHTAVIPAAGTLLQDTGTAREDTRSLL